MTFQRATPSANYRIVRLLSEGGRWELGLSHYARGVRVRMGLIGRPPSVVDFCLGGESGLYTPVLVAILHRLEAAPESATTAEIDALFPWAGTRPDPALHLPQLLAGAATPRMDSQLSLE